MSEVLLQPLEKLTKDLRNAARLIGRREARYLVDLYYQLQDARIRVSAQIRSALQAEEKEKEPNDTLLWVFNQTESLEGSIKSALNAYSLAQPVGKWAQSICGIGPVISAGLLAHIDITRAPTVGHIWRFAGLDPTQVWNKGERRPWNAQLKVLTWKIGESFVKVSGRESDIYGKVYLERKELEQRRNDSGLNRELALVRAQKVGKSTEAYKHYSQGHLPPGHVHARAKRYAVKLFLSHWHHVAYVAQFNTLPPRPYIIEHGGHTHFVAPPNYP